MKLGEGREEAEGERGHPGWGPSLSGRVLGWLALPCFFLLLFRLESPLLVSLV